MERTSQFRGSRQSDEYPTVTIALPVFDEARILGDNVGTLVECAAGLTGRYGWEILIIDDGSTDGTGEIADGLAAADPRIRAIHHPVNLNIGEAIRSATRNSEADYLVTYDIDLSYAPDHIGQLLDTITVTGAQVVVASPYMRGGTVTNVPWYRRTLSRWANRFLSWTSKSSVATVTGLVRAYDRRFLQKLDTKAMDNEFNSEVIYKTELMRGRIVEIPAHLNWTRDKVPGRKRSKMRLTRSTLGFAFSGFLFRPFMFFILPGLVILFLAIFSLGWVAAHTIRFYVEGTGSFDPRITSAFKEAFEHTPHTFIVGGFTLMVAIQLISLGIISAQSKRYFEELFHLGTTRGTYLRDDESP
jgi:glycosyltransferase involved in cell wall biosynthesis